MISRDAGAPNTDDLLKAAAGRLRAAGIAAPRLEARLLLSFAANAAPEDLISGRAVIDTAAVARFEAVVARRERREPAAYIVEHKEFWSLRFAVGPGALIPRPESETLVEEALQLFSAKDASLRVLDCGTGTGCLLLAVLHERPSASGIGIDRSPKALAYARRNGEKLGLSQRARWIEGDWADAPEGPFDLILANPPYIAAGELAVLEPELRFEPRGALAAGEDGLEAYRALAPELLRRLAPEGRALVELGLGQSEQVRDIFAQAGLAVLGARADLAGIPRCLVAAKSKE
jgi:release factor glutamine methyltransferase